MALCGNIELKRCPLLRVFFCLFFLTSGHCYGDALNVAVASNFAKTLKALSLDFKQQTGHTLRISSASTGKLYAQLQQGAPFDVFMSADEVRVERLVSEGKAIPSSAYVYAEGLLALVSNLPADDCQSLLFSDRIKRLSIANPVTAPYGLAAKQVLEKLLIWPAFKPRIVMGENVAQAFQFIYTKNAEAGFVARSMLLEPVSHKTISNKPGSNKPGSKPGSNSGSKSGSKSGGVAENGCVWNVPAGLHSPVRQKMVLMNRAKDKAAAWAFLQYMGSERAREIIKSSGYDVSP